MNKTFIQLLLFMLLNFSLVAQQIVSGEYFFDTAPNQGAGTPISFTPNSTLNHTMTIPTTGLNSGIHQLYVRVKNNANVWSHYQKRMVYVIEPLVIVNTSIIAAEWFIDTDPGVGNGTNLSITAGNTVSGTLSLPNAMSSGIHHLYIRVKNNLGKWSHQHKSMFYVIEPLVNNSTTIVKAEYFFDSDPGVGNDNLINVTSSGSIDQNLTIDLTGLTPGIHNLYVRTKNNRGIWGHYQSRMIYIHDQLPTENKTIVAAEYFIDTDPGLDQGINIPITAGSNLLEDFALNTNGISLGEHHLFIRVKESNGRWSHYSNHKFLICNDVLATPLISGNTTFCQNSEISLQGNSIPNATEYFWTGPNGFNQVGMNLSIASADFSHNGTYSFYAVRPGSSACDTAFAQISIEVLPNSGSINPQVICQGESYQINGNNYSSEGTYFDTLTAINGCDSIVETQLSVLPSYQIDDFQNLCEGQSYTINGNTYTQSGIYSNVFQTISGCDSTIITHLTINPIYSANNPQSICAGGSYTINGNTYTVAGNYVDVLNSTSGCDSTVNTILTVVNSFATNNPQVICEGESYSIGNNTYSQTGTYTDILLSTQGCDSVVTTELTVNPTFSINNPQTICEGEVYQINGNSYSNPGTYTDVFQTLTGCDSTIMTILSVTQSNFNFAIDVSVDGTSLISQDVNSTYQWLNCSNAYSTIPGETNQSFTATSNGEYAVQLTSSTCNFVDTSSCILVDNLNLSSQTKNAEVFIFPIPSNQFFTVLTENLLFDFIKIYNLEGKVIYSSSVKEKTLTIDASNWSDGVYNLELVSKDKVIHQKIIKANY
jgi:hypothetical protein